MGGLYISEVQTYDLDSVERTLSHGKIISSKKVLRKIYIDWYNSLKNLAKDNTKGKAIEIGSGSGFIKEVIPNVVTTEILNIETVDTICSVYSLPFESDSLDVVYMIDVLHHLQNPVKALNEILRVLKSDGMIILSEPDSNWYTNIIFRNFHHEPFMNYSNWTFRSSGPLSGANGALPWIVLKRDFKLLNNLFPNLVILEIIPHTTFRYLLSGGVSLNQLLPTFTFSIIEIIDNLISLLGIGMFSYFVLQKKQISTD
jgi:SAM-dependent methyltransferase